MGSVTQLRQDVRDWAMEQDNPSIPALDDRAHEYISSKLENDFGTLHRDALIEIVNDNNLWGDDVSADAGSLEDAMRLVVIEFYRNELEDEWDDIKNDMHNGTLTYCSAGGHWYDEDDADECDDCGTMDCPDHGEIEDVGDLLDEDGDEYDAKLCSTCLSKAQDTTDEIRQARREAEEEYDAAVDEDDD